MRRIVTFSECDSPNEMQKILQELFDNQAQLAAKVSQLAKDAEKKPKKERKLKEGGFVTVRNMLLAIVIAIVVTVSAFCYVATDIDYDIASNPETLSQYLRDSIGAGTFTFTPISAPSGNAIVEGKMYYDSSANTFYGSKNGTTWTEFATGGATSLDAAYNVGNAIDVDTSAVTMTTSDTDNNVVLAIVQNEATNDNDALTVTMGTGATGNAIEIDSQSSGTDIAGDNWSVSQAGAITAVGLTSTGGITTGVDGTGVDNIFYADTAGSNMTWDQDGDTNGSLILTGASQTITGIDSGGNLLTVTGIDTTGNSDTVVITHSGTGAALQINSSEADTQLLELISAANQTTWLQVIDGAAGNWIGADDVGMLTLKADTALAHAGASQLQITNTATPIASAEGFLARFIDTGSNQATTAYAVEIETTNNEALHVDSGKVLVDETLTATLGLQVGVGETLTAAAAEGAGQQVDDDISVGNVTATNDADGFITLPNDPAIGTVVKIMCNAGSNFEIRTLAAGDDTINDVDTSDGATEYLATDTDMIVFTCHAADSWIGVSYTKLGAVRTAVVPD